MNTRGSPVVLALALLTAVVFLLQGCSPEYARPRSETRLLTDGHGSGSGVVLRPGLVLTAGHVAVHPGLVIAGKFGKAGDAAVANEGVDLGLIRYTDDSASCPCVRLADHEAEVDEAIIIVGYPYGIGSVITEGRSQGVMLLPDGKVMLVITATAAPGNSGGAVYAYRDGRWQLVGILTAAAERGSVSLAVPLSSINAFLAANAK